MTNPILGSSAPLSMYKVKRTTISLSVDSKQGTRTDRPLNIISVMTGWKKKKTECDSFLNFIVTNTMSKKQNDSPWSGHRWCHHQRKSLRCVLCIVFWNRKTLSTWISWNLDKSLTLTIKSKCWLNWRLKFPDSGQKRKWPFTCNIIMLEDLGSYCKFCPVPSVIHNA